VDLEGGRSEVEAQRVRSASTTFSAQRRFDSADWSFNVSSYGSSHSSSRTKPCRAESTNHRSHDSSTYDILSHARADPLWRVHEVPGPPPWVDPERLAEQRRRLPPSSYQRLYLNEWTAAEDRLATKEALAACVQFDGPLPPEDGLDYVVAVDVGLVADRTAVAVCHLEPVLVDDLRVWEGSHERPVALNGVQQHVRDVSARYHRAEVVLDPWQTAAMGQSLRADGIAVTEFSFTSSSAGNLGLLLYRLIQGTNLALPEDPELLAELASVRLRPSGPGLLRLDHDRGRHDDRAVALAMAAHRLLDRPLPRRARLIV